MKFELERKLRQQRHKLWCTTALSVGLAIAVPGFAHAQDVLLRSQVKEIAAPANTEKAEEAYVLDGPGFSISVDGERVSGAEQAVDKQRKTDVALEAIDVQVKFDGLGVEPVLNVSTADLRSSYNAGDVIEFISSSNYPDWIEYSEIWIYEQGDERKGRPFKVLKISGNHASWEMPQDGKSEYTYVLRVYDQAGRYDETVPLPLNRTTSQFPTHEVSNNDDIIAPGEGEDRTELRNIPVYGGAVTVYGENVPTGYTVQTLGEQVPIDNENKFVIQRILPPGDHVVEIDIHGSEDGLIAFDREVHIPENEWFYVGLSDITVGHRNGSENLVPAAPGEFDRTYTRGRFAFYLKGKIKGEYILTAAADTQEDDFENLFTNLDAKDPRQLLRRIDPDDYYPVYGDDSEIVEDAPTNGNFYVRLEKGQSHALWGNFKTEISGTEFARVERGLYGAHTVLKSEEVTSYGEPVAEIEAYAAQPETLPQRDILRGTGGSVYFLTQQDVTRGSETVTIEIRDPVSLIVRSRQVLRYGEDYDIDYVQGVVILTSPLSSTADGTSLVSESALGDDIVNLVVQYEFTPALGDVDGYSYGGRAQAWLNDHVKVGVSGISENTGPANHDIIEADITVRMSENSYFRAEVAESNGPGFGRSSSINGGLTINGIPTSGVESRRARAYRAEADIDVSDLDPDQKGKVGAYFERREAGFSSLDYETTVTQRIWGVFADVDVSEDLRYRLGYEDFEDAANRVNRELDAEIEYALDPHWAALVGGKFTERKNPGTTLDNGRRVDIAARLVHKPDEDRKGWIFGQVTIDRSGDIERNDRVGVGAELRLTEKVAVNAEVSVGTSGWGGEAGVKYDPTPDDHYYIGYRVDPDRERSALSNLDSVELGSIVAGARHRYSNLWSVFLENSFDLEGASRSLTSTYGVTYTPDALWTVDGGVEYGDVDDLVSGALQRIALSASVAYNDNELITWHLKGEGRFEDSNVIGLDRNTFLASAGMLYKHNADWRVLLNIDAAISDSDQAAFLDGDYIEASIGYAYRPVANDRLNALFKYNFLYDLPGPDQVTVDGITLGPAQRSHILSADFTYDLNKYLSLGGKYGFRIGEVSATRAADDFVQSSAHLGVIRFDWHVVNNWDFLFEGRVLDTPEIDTTDYGILAAIYRHLGDNFKVGVGYNFGQFSDDVADLTQDDGGVFVNVVGKF